VHFSRIYYALSASVECCLQDVRSQSDYIPFGTGPKGCVGQFLAMIEMKVIMSQLLRRYRVMIATDDSVGGLVDASQSLDTVSTRWDIAQQPTTPTYMRLVPRRHPHSS